MAKKVTFWKLPTTSKRWFFDCFVFDHNFTPLSTFDIQHQMIILSSAQGKNLFKSFSSLHPWKKKLHKVLFFEEWKMIFLVFNINLKNKWKTDATKYYSNHDISVNEFLNFFWNFPSSFLAFLVNQNQRCHFWQILPKQIVWGIFRGEFWPTIPWLSHPPFDRATHPISLGDNKPWGLPGLCVGEKNAKQKEYWQIKKNWNRNQKCFPFH